MASRVVSFLMGLVYLFFGIAGFVPAAVAIDLEKRRFLTDTHLLGTWGFIFGWLPTNTLHNIFYIVLGAGGLIAVVTRGLSYQYCRVLFWITLLGSIAGMLPFGINTVWGLIPLFDWNIMLHTTTAVIAFYYGYIYPLDLGGPEPAAELEAS